MKTALKFLVLFWIFACCMAAIEVWTNTAAPAITTSAAMNAVNGNSIDAGMARSVPHLIGLTTAGFRAGLIFLFVAASLIIFSSEIKGLLNKDKTNEEE